ncbi:tyrosine-type recombinase/integrase [Blautia sp. MSJ-9]|uniref:tyrosine-type recombinase/integrase n=1 Tax=Blautia sp. MSJ-9 TaxID=2841511 RepID=UPI001C1010D0|nr:tyrosine-type recombinase/integrase [Blautia sp. MSJ-9]MBU5678993.1 tyrosine-type recombinase/integrase [Blautia sp. MSJ-9]
MQTEMPAINELYIQDYLLYLKEQERSNATIQKYAHDLYSLLEFLQDRVISKSLLINWKQELIARYAPASVNAMLAAVNGYLRFMGWMELTVKPLKIQRSLFLEEERELTREEYIRLVKAAQAKENERLALVIQTICATGIRVSELKFITVEAVQSGRAEIANKGKRRVVFLPDQLRKVLKKYIRNQKKTAGAVFTTRTGKPLDRSNIWRDMKKLCESAGVSEKKVFPHNLRHLFARTFYSIEKDLSRLADILGHTNLTTTRIYTAESGAVHARQMERLGLIVT